MRNTQTVTMSDATPGVSLLCAPAAYKRDLEARLEIAAQSPATTEYSPASIKLCQIELAFILAKESVLTESVLHRLSSETTSSHRIIKLVQDFLVKMMIIFLNTLPQFQSLSDGCQARLLSKNMTEVATVLLTMGYQRSSQVFRCGFSSHGEVDGGEYKIVEVSIEEICSHFSRIMGAEISKVVSDIAEQGIPDNILLVLVIILVFSRDGYTMESQASIDEAHSYYRQLLFLCIKATTADSPRLNAKLHRVLKTSKDLAELLRTQNFDFAN